MDNHAGGCTMSENHFAVVRAVLAADLPAAAKLVLLALHDRQGANGAAWPSLTRLSRDTHLCRETVIQAVGKLEEAGVLTVDRPKHPSVKTSNRYTIQTGLISRLVHKTDWSKKQTGSGLRSRPDLVRNIDPNVVINEPTNEQRARKQRAPRAAPQRFTPPKVDEVSEYCKERQNTIDPKAFVDFYTAKGWLVGKTKMRDWRAAVRTWEQRRKAERPQAPVPDPEAAAIARATRAQLEAEKKTRAIVEAIP